MNSTVRLTAREYEVAEKLALGASKKEIPDLLITKPGHRPISIQTIEVITKNIYSKLGIQKVSELCVWYFSTRYHIDVDLSPIKKRFIALLLLLTIMPAEVMIIKEALRPRMSCRTYKSISRTPIRRKDDTYNLELA